VKGYILDTNVVILADAQSVRLSTEAKGAIARGPSFVSLLAYWEVVIKSMKGNLDVGDPWAWWDRSLRALELSPLMLTPPHIDWIRNLPPIHRDPFDRALIAQAIVEDLTLVTTDGAFERYREAGLQVIR
jgi:PIN domain nuclease of toxin-antitoxin system